MASQGVIIAGLSSSSGKTLISLGLMRACRRQGLSVAAAKTGPDYIDPGFHAAALSAPSVNLDPFAMGTDLLRHLASLQEGETLLIEGVMGVFDGGASSTACLAQALDLPVILVMDIRGQAETAAAVAAGIRARLGDMEVDLAGVILNRARSSRHGQLCQQELQQQGIATLGIIPETGGVHVPSRHLGLVQAEDIPALEAILDTAAETVAANLELNSIIASARPLARPASPQEALPPPAARIAIAKDAAFGFGYDHLIRGWQRQGAAITVFSPLANEAPAKDASWVFLPGGYPELHLGPLNAAEAFKSGMHHLAKAGVPIYGECGGYMVLGQAIIGKDGQRTPMLGLLDVETSFAAPKLNLGYRRLQCLGEIGLPRETLGHEFHYTTAITTTGAPLFEAEDRDGNSIGSVGLIKGNIAGSYMHLIAAA